MNSLFIVIMKKMHFSKILLIVFLLSNIVDTKSYGQSTSSYEFGSGLHFESSDQNYQFDLGGLMLPYISYESLNDETTNMYYGSKRTFFHFKANSEKENVSAYFLTDFSSNNPLLEAWVSYKPVDRLSFTFGQFRSIANNREMLMFENSLAYFSRSLLSQTFNASGREFGLKCSYVIGHSDFSLIPMIQITSGDGMNSFGVDSRDVDLGGLKYASRIDVYPLGLFKEGQVSSVNDYAQEESLKVVIGAAASYNDGASNSVGEGHGDFYLFNNLNQVMLPDYRELNIDFLSKYKGFSLMGEYSISTATGLEGLVTESLIQELQPTDISTYLALGTGLSMQIFYTTKKGYSLGFINSSIKSEFENVNSIIKDSNLKSFVLSKRIKDSAVVIQNSLDILKISDENTHTYRFQIQIEF